MVPCNQTLSNNFSKVSLVLERNIVNDLSTALKSSQARDTTRLVKKHNPSNQCKNRHMSQVLNEQPTHVGKNIKASQHVNSTGEPVYLSYSSSTDLSQDSQVQFLSQKPTQLVTSQPKPFCPLPHP